MEAIIMIYLLAIVGAEVVTTLFVPLWGILYHIAILTAVLVYSALVYRHYYQQLLLPLTLVPLSRIISLTVPLLPLADVPRIWLYPAIYGPLLVAAVVITSILRYSAFEIGLNSKRLTTQFIVGGTGFILGLVGYLILKPEPLITVFAWYEVVLAAAILLLYTGLAVELVFRGVIQHSTVDVIGGWGIIYVSLLFATLYIETLSLVHVIFAFVISLYFGWIAKKTGSILGVGLAHGILNIILYLFAPLLLG